MAPTARFLFLAGCSLLAFHCQCLVEAFSWAHQRHGRVVSRPRDDAFVRTRATDDTQCFVQHVSQQTASHGNNGIQQFMSSMVACTAIFCSVVSLSCTLLPSPSQAITFNSPTSTSSVTISTTNLVTEPFFLLANDEDGNEQEYSSLNLKQPTESQPQIKLPKNSLSADNKAQSKRPILQGLVYFAEQQTVSSAFPADYNDDLIILTALPLSSKEPILAGSKLPVSSVRFPFLFKMYKENLLLQNTKDVWFGTMGEMQDVIVEARICPRDAAKFPCGDGETKRVARGIAKVVGGLPGLEEGEVVRAPASLPLQ